jgi:selenocysteine lyase/cysteine desulfurase
MQHATRIWEHLASLGKVSTLGRLSDGEHIAVVSFTADHMAAQQLAEMLDADYHVCVRAGLQCAPGVHEVFGTTDMGGALRVSPGYFTQAEEVDHLLSALTDLLS